MMKCLFRFNDTPHGERAARIGLRPARSPPDERSEMMRRYFRSDYSMFPSEPCWGAVCIPLTRGRHALIDASDYGRVSAHCWSVHNAGYAVSTKAAPRRMHRLIMTPPHDMPVDHINGNILDNRRSNLRVVTVSQNNKNRIANRNASSRYLGVSWRSDNKCWTAHITDARGKSKYLGSFDHEADAARAYNAAAKVHHGEFAKLNHVEM